MILNFNPRTHRGVRHVLIGVSSISYGISIHAPIVGCDMSNVFFINLKGEISIHAPIVGCDCIKKIHLYFLLNFNPRTHRGVRQYHSFYFSFLSRFQSTHPSWGATITVLVNGAEIWKISIHAPIVGCDGSTGVACMNTNRFQSTHPSWGATRYSHIVGESL